MEITRFADLKPRTVWEIVDDAFDMYRERFSLLASISAVVIAPALLLYTTVGAGAISDLFRSSDGPDHLWSATRSLAWTMPLLGIAYVLQSGATAFAVRDTLTGQPSTLVSVFQRTFRRALPLVASSLIIGFFSLLSICVIIGPLFVIAWYSFTPQGILLEDRKLLDAAKRSRDMAASYFSKILGMMMLTGSVGAILHLGFSALITFVFAQLGAHGNGTPYDRESTEGVIRSVTSSVITVLIAPIPAIATSLLYYDLRVRREGLDIESEAESLHVALAPDPFGGVLNPKVPKAARK